MLNNSSDHHLIQYFLLDDLSFILINSMFHCHTTFLKFSKCIHRGFLYEIFTAYSISILRQAMSPSKESLFMQRKARTYTSFLYLQIISFIPIAH